MCKHRLTLGVLVLLVLVVPASAATRTWTGLGADTNWTTPANWDVLPVAGDDLVFPGGVPAPSLTNNNDFPAGTAFNSITFSANGYALNGNQITLGAGGIAGTSNVAPQTNDINFDIALGADVTIDLVNGNQLTISGVISGPQNILKTGSGNVQLAGANTFSGTFSLNGYLLVILDGQALGAADGTPATGTTVAPFTAIDIFNPVAVGNEALTLNGSGAGGPGALYTVAAASWAGPITLATDTTIAPLAGTLSLDGPIGGPGGLTMAGSATLLLTAAETYGGPTMLNAGETIVQGSISAASPVTVNTGALLGLSNSGTVGAVTSIGGTVFPGRGGSGVGNSGDLTLDAASTFTVQLNSTVPGFFSNLHVTGAVGLGGSTLSVGVGPSTNPGDAFTIIDNDGVDAVNGIFNGLPEGTIFNTGGFQFQITYVGGTGNDIVLTEIAGAPTPTPTPTATVTPTVTITPGGPTPTPIPPPAGGTIPTLSFPMLALLAVALAATALLVMRKNV